MNLTSNRAAPVFALLVILIGLAIFLTVSSATPNFASVPTLHPDAIEYTLSSETQYHRSRGDLQAALFYVDVQANQDGWSAALHEEAGNLWRDMGDLSRALPHWEVVAQLDPQPDNLRRLADLNLQAGDWGTAYQYLEQLLQLVPDDTWGLYYGGLLLAPSDTRTARDYLNRVTSSETYGTQAQ